MTNTSFEAQLYTIGSITILRIPKDISATLPSRGQVMVKGTVNGVDFSMPAEPDGDGSHWLALNEDLLSTAGANSDDTVVAIIESAKEWPEPEIPADLQNALQNAAPEVQALWEKVTPMAHWEWLRWIGSTLNPETRAKRIEVSISKLSKGMRRPCCFNRSMCCVPEVSKNGVLISQ